MSWLQQIVQTTKMESSNYFDEIDRFVEQFREFPGQDMVSLFQIFGDLSGKHVEGTVSVESGVNCGFDGYMIQVKDENELVLMFMPVEFDATLDLMK